MRTTSGPHIVRKRLASGDRYYVYASRGGPLIHTQDRVKPAITPALLAKAARASGRLPRDNLDYIIDLFRAAPEFETKAGPTQREYRLRLDQISAKFGKVPIHLIPNLRGEIIKWRDELSETPRAADRCVGMLSTLLSWAEDREMIDRNPAAKIGKLHSVNRADLIWEPRHWDAVQTCPGYIRRALTLGSLTGLRIGDLLRLAWEDLQPGYIALRTRKTGGEAIIPLHCDLERFFTGPGRGIVLRNTQGKPWTLDGWHTAWQRTMPKGFDRHVHDLRGTFATKLMAAGFTDSEIAIVMGWRAERIAAIRMRYVDRGRVARAMAERLRGGAV